MLSPTPKNSSTFLFFGFEILTSTGKLVQVLYKGEAPGDADIGEQVIVKGIDKGGVIHARSIYNLSTNSWVTPPPGLFQKIFGDWF